MTVKEQPDRMETADSNQLLFGPLGREAYPVYAQRKIEDQFGNPANEKGIEVRRQLWQNYEGLQSSFSVSGDKDVLQATYDYIKGLNDFARNQLEARPAGGLGIHLQEITQFSRNFLLDEQGQSRFPGVISSHNAHLFAEVVAPIHDVLKFLSPRMVKLCRIMK